MTVEMPEHEHKKANSSLEGSLTMGQQQPKQPQQFPSLAIRLLSDLKQEIVKPKAVVSTIKEPLNNLSPQSMSFQTSFASFNGEAAALPGLSAQNSQLDQSKASPALAASVMLPPLQMSKSSPIKLVEKSSQSRLSQSQSQEQVPQVLDSLNAPKEPLQSSLPLKQTSDTLSIAPLPFFKQKPSLQKIQSDSDFVKPQVPLYVPKVTISNTNVTQRSQSQQKSQSISVPVPDDVRQSNYLQNLTTPVTPVSQMLQRPFMSERIVRKVSTESLRSDEDVTAHLRLSVIPQELPSRQQKLTKPAIGVGDFILQKDDSRAQTLDQTSNLSQVGPLAQQGNLKFSQKLQQGAVKLKYDGNKHVSKIQDNDAVAKVIGTSKDNPIVLSDSSTLDTSVHISTSKPLKTAASQQDFGFRQQSQKSIQLEKVQTEPDILTVEVIPQQRVTPASNIRSVSKSTGKSSLRVNSRDKQAGRTRVHKIVNQSRVDDLQTFFETAHEQQGEDVLDVSICDTSNVTPFHFACLRGNPTILRMLLDNHSSMFFACYNEAHFETNEKVVELYQKGFAQTDFSSFTSLHARDSENCETPLHDIVIGLIHSIRRVATSGKDTLQIPGYKLDVDLKYHDCCQVMLEFGCCVGIYNKSRNTALDVLISETEYLKDDFPDLFSTDNKSEASELLLSLIGQVGRIEQALSNYDSSTVSPFIFSLDEQQRSVIHAAPYLDSSRDVIDALSLFIRCGSDIGVQDCDGYSVLHDAVLSLNVDVVFYLCAMSNTSIAADDKDGRTLFSRKSQLELLSNQRIRSSKKPLIAGVVKELPELVNAKGESALHLCLKVYKQLAHSPPDECSKQDVKYLLDCCVQIARILIAAGVDVFIKDNNQSQAFDYLTSTNDENFVFKLQELAATIGSLRTEVTDKIPTPLPSAPVDSREERLIKQQSVIMQKLSVKKSARKRISSEQKPITLKESNKKSKKDSKPDSPTVVSSSVYKSSRKDRGKSIESLSSSVATSTNLKRGSVKYDDKLDPFVRDAYGQTMLQKEARDGYLENCVLLLERGANVNAQDNGGYSSLSEAANNGHFEVVQLLLKHGGDPNVHGIEGETPLQEAVKVCDVQSVQLILEYGGDPYATNNSGKIASDYLQDQLSSPLSQLSFNAITENKRQIKKLLDNYDPKMIKHGDFHRNVRQKQVQEQVKRYSSPPLQLQKTQKKRKTKSASIQSEQSRIQTVKKAKRIIDDLSSKADERASAIPKQTQSTHLTVVAQSVQQMPLMFVSDLDLRIDESLLPIVSFRLPEVSGQDSLFVLDVYLAQLVGFGKNASRMFLFFGKNATLRETLKRERQSVTAQHAQLLNQCKDMASHHQAFIGDCQLVPDKKQFWVPYLVFRDLMVPYYIEATQMDALDAADLVDEQFAVVNLQ